MSYRVYLDNLRDPSGGDFHVPADGSVADAVTASAWQRPLKVIFRDVSSLHAYLTQLDQSEGVDPDAIWQLYQRPVLGPQIRFGPEHPSWNDLRPLLAETHHG